MPGVKVETVEKRIANLEGFDVKFLDNGKDVHGNKENTPQYPFTYAAKNDMTVAEWKETRFQQTYPGYDVAVLDGNGSKVPGQTRLSTLRESYR